MTSPTPIRDPIPFLTIGPSAPHTHTVIFLHGRGDNAQHFAASLTNSRDSRNRTLFQSFPSFRWVFPKAPTQECVSSRNIWPQWFDVWNVRDFSDNEFLQVVGLREVIPGLRDILANEARLVGGRWDRIILAGISMGAATAVHVLFNLNLPAGPAGRLGAFLGFSCRCPFSGRTLAEMREILELQNVPEHADVIRYTPMLLEHCIDDPLVRVENGRALRDTLRQFGAAQIEWREYPSGGHWFNSPAGMDDAVQFLNKHALGISPGPAVPLAKPAQSTDSMDLSW